MNFSFQMGKSLRIIDNLISYLILAILILIPLFFNTFTYITFESGKIVLFRILTEALVLAFFAKIFLSSEIKTVKNGGYFYFSLVFLFLAQAVSTFFSDHFSVSFWGSYWRGMGFFTQLHLFAFAFIVFNELPGSKAGMKKIFCSIAVSSSVVSLYGIAQLNGFDLFKWQETGILNRASSSLGQPNFMASFLLLSIPLSVYLYRESRSKLEKYLWLAFIFIGTWSLVLTFSRAAWIGAIVSAAVWFILFLYGKNRKLFILSLSAALLIIGAFLFLSFNRPVAIKSDDTLTLGQRVASLANAYQGSSMIRIYYYQAAAEIIRSAPLIGHGPDSQPLYFYKYYQPDYAVYEMINRYPDRSHNEFLDILITTGFLGLSAWLCLFYFVLRKAREYISGKVKEKFLVKLIIFSLSSFMISIMFGFFNITTAVYFWFLVALLYNIIAGGEKTTAVEIKIKKYIFSSFLAIFAVFIAFISWNYNFKALLADYYFRNVKSAQVERKYAEIIPYYLKIFETAPAYLNMNHYRSQLLSDGLDIISQTSIDKGKAADVLAFLSGYLESADDTAFENKLLKAVLMAEIGWNKSIQNMDGAKEFSAAEEIFLQLSNESPKIALIYFEWGKLENKRKNYDGALSKYYQAITLYPDLDNPDMNDEHRRAVAAEESGVYAAIAETMANLKKYDAAEVYYKKALFINPYNFQAVQKLKRLYFLLEKNDKAIDLLDHMSVLLPYNSDIFYELADVYKFLNDKESAIKNIKIAIRLNKQRRYENFLEELEKKPAINKEYLKIFEKSNTQ